MYSFRRFIASILRVGSSRGFGIQSPFAFRFVTEVVRDRGHYAEYGDLEREYGGNRTELRLRKFYVRLLKYVNDGNDDYTLLYIIEGIHRDRRSYKVWREIIQDGKVRTSFDLYDCGILFLDKKLHKRNYKVMLR